MKKLISLLLCLLMISASVFTLASCFGAETKDKVKVIDIALTVEEYAFAVAKTEDGDALKASVNELLTEMKGNGEFDKIIKKYFAGEGTPTGYEKGTIDETKDQLIVATSANFAPFEYTEGNKYYGVDIEIMAALAEKLNKELVINDMAFSAVIQNVASGYSDIVASGLTYSETRAETVNFSNTYYNASQMLVVKADDTTFDACENAEQIEAILATLTKDTKVGGQAGTTGILYMQGDADWGFDGYAATVKDYETAALAINDMLNGNVSFVVVDEGPAKMISAKMNGN